jgi:type VI secretion system protein
MHPPSFLELPVASRCGRLAATLACALALTGCSTLGDVAGKVGSLVGLGTPRAVEPEWRSVAVVAATDANGNSPVALDLVFVRDATLATALATLPAERWFAGRADTLRSNPEAVSAISMELVPGQTVRLGEKDLEGKRALAVFVFAGYPAPGEHRQRLLLDAHAYLLQLGARDFKATVVRPGDLK